MMAVVVIVVLLAGVSVLLLSIISYARLTSNVKPILVLIS